nr:hypothetical protein CFP56_69064 [Quercus suber]
MLIFVMGKQHFCDSVESGDYHERLEALRGHHSTRPLTSLAFWRPTTKAAMAELRLSPMNQMAVQLIIICLRMVAQVLETSDGQATTEGGVEYWKLAAVVQRELSKALQYFWWQLKTNQFGRARDLTALLGDTLRILRTEAEFLMDRLRSHARARSALRDVARAMGNSIHSSAERQGREGSARIPRESAKRLLPADRQGGDRSTQRWTAFDDVSDGDELSLFSVFGTTKLGKRDSVTGDAGVKPSTEVFLPVLTLFLNDQLCVCAPTSWNHA